MTVFSLQNNKVNFVQTGYGKDMVKVLHIQRDGKYHTIKEVVTSVQLTLSSKKDYLIGDNSDIIPTDTIKNTVHVLAKMKGVRVILLRCYISLFYNMRILPAYFKLPLLFNPTFTFKPLKNFPFLL